MNDKSEDNPGMDGYESDTGFSSQGSDEVLEDLEIHGTKRKHSDDESDTESPNGEKLEKNKKLFKPPTAEELNHLKETQNLFHSNLFRMQIEEVLKEIQVKEKKKLDFESWFQKFSKAVLMLKDGANKYSLEDQQWLKNYKIRMPMPKIPTCNNGTFQFKRPSQVILIGSYAANLVVGPKFTADVLIEMPQSFFQKEDFLNCRYQKKRSLYMCEVVHQLQLFPNLVENIAFLNEETNSLKPLVELTPFGKLGKHILVKLHFCPEQGSFKLNRFVPSKSNVRRKWLFNEASNKEDMLPTPFYNSTILTDLVALENYKFLKETLLMHNNIRDGIILLKIWLKQRELDCSIGGFNGFLVAMLVCYLLHIKKINVLMSSYQVFRHVCNFLVSSDWTTNGITLCKNTNDTCIPTMTEFHGSHKVVFLDSTGYLNMCFAMSTYTFKQVQHEAQYALDCLNNAAINSFQALFISKVPFYQHFDHVVIFNNGEVLDNIADNYSAKDVRLNYCTVTSHLARESIINLLLKGLDKRITRMCVKLPTSNRWKIIKKYKPTTTLTIGFNLNSTNYFSIIDKALESETESFREFWGERSELRRFQDGTITEAVVWTGRTLAEKRLICKEIVTYLLKSKLGLDGRDFHYIANQLDCYIGKNVEEASLSVIEAYDQLVKQLRDLNELPLDVVNVQGTSPVLRYTDVFPPLPQKERTKIQKKNHYTHTTIIEGLNSCPLWISPIDVTVKMAASSKWPQDLEGIKRIRAAFNIKISESLASQFGVVSEAFPDQVEVIKNGYVFRLRVVYPNEIALLKKMVDTDGLIKYRDTEKSMIMEKESVDLPKLSSALHGLYQAYNSFGPACCMVKRWISSHMLDSYHISEECIELLVASLYLRPQPNEPPCQPQVAFFRFHYLMATTNWNTECLILNMNDELTRQDIMEIESDFNLNRDCLPPVFIVTPYDRKKSVFTRDSPTPLILLRLIELCANALHLIEDKIYSQTLFDNRILFQPCLDSYDVLIIINDTYNPRKKAVPGNLDSLATFRQSIPINGFDPVSIYLGELRDNYGELALFFHDSYGGSTIGLIWKPTALEPCEFKVPNLAGRKLNPKTKLLDLNKDAILEDFWHIGKGLVKQINFRVNGSFEVYEVLKKEHENS